MYNYTIIIPHYNLPDLIVRALNSIPQRDDLQIIIVDDCSTRYAEMKHNIDALGRNDITILETPQNGGAGLARNIGLDHAVGKWIIFIDADDLLMPNAFDIFDKYVNSTADHIIFNSKSVMSDDLSVPSNRSQRTKKMQDYLSGKNMSLRYGPAQPWGRMIRRSLIEDNKIRFPLVRWSEDLLFAIKTSTLAREFLAVNEVVYIITEREGSNANTLSNKNIKPSLEECIVRFDQTIDSYRFLCANGINNITGFILGKRRRLVDFYRWSYYKMIFSNPKRYRSIYLLELKFLGSKIKQIALKLIIRRK